MKNNKNIYLKKIEENKHLNFCLSLINKTENKKGKLFNYCVAVKDNFNVCDSITTGGSKFLEEYVSPYNATVIDLLISEGATLLCKTNLDEFGLGGTGLYSAYGNVINPIDEKRISGGSSSGSAVAIKIGACDFALGTDTGDSIRRPASFLGIIGYKPSYGLISRYGVLPYSPSLDHVGLFSKKIDIILLVMSVIAKHDEKDFTSQNHLIDFGRFIDYDEYDVAIPKECFEGVKPEIKTLFYTKIQKLKRIKFKNVSYSQDLLDVIPATYNILSYSEAVSCYQNLSTILFGPKFTGDNYIQSATTARSKLFGNELKRRFLIGAYCTGEENYNDLFLNSSKVRTKIKNENMKILEKSDLIISLGSGDIAPLIVDVNNKVLSDLNADTFLQVANFGGFPSITIPFIEFNGNPIGINISGKLNDDLLVLSCAKYIIDVLHEDGEYSE